jgi:hypothetical protein
MRMRNADGRKARHVGAFSGMSRADVN